MLEKLPDYEKQLTDIDEKLGNPETMQDMKLFRSLNQERSHLAPIIDELKEMQSLQEQIADAKQLLKEEKDPEMLELTEQELDELTEQLARSEQKTKMLLIPPLIQWKGKTSSWKSAQEPVGKRLPSLLQTCSVCTPTMLMPRDGRWKYSPPMKQVLADIRN